MNIYLYFTVNIKKGKYYFDFKTRYVVFNSEILHVFVLNK